MPTINRTLRTRRLDLIAATLEHVSAELEDHSSLGRLLGIPIPADWPPGEYDRHAIEYFQSQLLAGGSAVVGWYGWYAITRNTEGLCESLVAGAGYFGPPREGVVEIGYSVIPAARRQGYASEIVTALVVNAFEDPSVQQVVAHTTDENIASIKVLLGRGFIRVGPGAAPGSVQYCTKRTRYVG